MYNPSSLNAEEFICHDEALASIAYASENRNNLGLVDSIIEKAERKKGLSARSIRSSGLRCAGKGSENLCAG